MKSMLNDGTIADVALATRAQKPFVANEKVWLSAPDAENSGARSRVKITRWSKKDVSEDQPLEVYADQEDECHLVTFAMRKIEMELRIGKKEIVGSAFPLHRPLLYCPTAEKRTAIFQSPFNTLRIYLPQDLIKECYETVLDKAAPNKVELFETHFSDDLVVDKLTRALVALADDDGPFGPSMVEAAGLALGARLLALSMRAPSNPIAEKYGSLAKWRLRRTIEYLEENLTDPIYLADLATVAGLSRMHFAAQFRAATGLSPHVYIIRRRIEVAQQLMLDTNRSIADISIAVGFSSQAHFTSAFKKINGVSPGQWRGRLLLD